MNSRKLSTALALLILGEIGRADPLDMWTPRNPVPPDSSPLGIVYGDVQFVAVGGGGTIVTSADGLNWVQPNSGTTNLLKGIAYGNGQFVAVGGAGTVVTSADGINWVQRQSGWTGLLNGIAYGNGRFVSVGKNSIISTSSDGATWVLHWFGTNGMVGRFSSIAYGNGRFVAVGELVTPGENLATLILTSDDSVNWVLVQVPNTVCSLSSVCYGNGQFVAVGADLSGTGNIILSSADGVNWVQRQVNGHRGATSEELGGVAYGAGLFVAVGEYFDELGLDHGTILTSGDGINWVQRESGTEDYLQGVVYGNGHFVIAGGTILRSGSIITLTLTSNPADRSQTLSLEGQTGLAYTVQTSTDLVSWTSLTNFISLQTTEVISVPDASSSGGAFYRAYTH